MINLLPPEEKAIIQWERKKRLVIILLFLISVLIVSFVLFLLTIRFYLEGVLSSQIVILNEEERRSKQTEIQNLKQEIKEFNHQLVRLESFYKEKFYFSEILEEISELLPEGSYLTNISITKGKSKENVLDVSLSGFASSREDLLVFRENLRQQKNIKNISFPPSNWVNPVNINFLATFEISK